MTANENNVLYTDIAQVIEQTKQIVRSTANSAMVITYWNIGRLIVEQEQKGEKRAEYGKQLVKTLSTRLVQAFGKSFEPRNLQYMRKFYLSFSIVNSVSSQSVIPIALTNNTILLPDISFELSWTHYRHLLKVEDESARLWYMQEAVQENWSTRALERQINSFYYQRLLASKNRKPVQDEADEKCALLPAHELLKDPYVLEFLGLQNRPEYTETELESALMEQLQQFLLELGSGFSFVARQKHIDLDGEHYYIDLVFYNYKLKCFVLIDLKRGKLTHQDIGQMDTYIRLYEDKFRAEDDNPTIGLILCSDKSEALVKYSMLADHQQMFASKYKLHLPSEAQLQQEFQRELNLLEELQK